MPGVGGFGPRLLTHFQWIRLFVGTSRDIIAEKKQERAEKRAQKKEARSAAQQVVTRKQEIAEKRKKFNLIPRETALCDGGEVQLETPFYLQKFVRDLEWVLTSPFLLSPEAKYPTVRPDWFSSLRDTQDAILRRLDQQPQIFFEWASQRRVRSNNLGGYFALLVHFWMTQCADFEEINVKYQMFDGRRTIGDMDFVFWDRSASKRSTCTLLNLCQKKSILLVFSTMGGWNQVLPCC